MSLFEWFINHIKVLDLSIPIESDSLKKIHGSKIFKAFYGTLGGIKVNSFSRHQLHENNLFFEIQELIIFKNLEGGWGEMWTHEHESIKKYINKIIYLIIRNY